MPGLRALASLAAIAGVTAVAGVGCGNDGTAKVRILDSKFWAVEAVTAFPAKLDAKGQLLGRVCGAPLDPQDPDLPPELTGANGLELTANLIRDGSRNQACSDDRDWTMQAGEYVDRSFVDTTTLLPENFQLLLRCLAQPGLPCESTATTSLTASAVGFKQIAPHCNAQKLDKTSVNLALVLDNSGSINGQVDKDTLKEDAQGQYDFSEWNTLSSDYDGARLNAVAEMVTNGLNENDRVVAYYFDESGSHIAASDAYVCSGDEKPCDPTKSRTTCQGTDCDPCNGASDSCDPDPGAVSTDTYSSLPLEAQECMAFGASPVTRADLINGIQNKVKNYSTGRAPLWKTVSLAYDFLHSNGAKSGCDYGPLSARHILVVTDGPDTCTDCDDFSYRTLKNANVPIDKCRPLCPSADVGWRKLMIRMVKDALVDRKNGIEPVRVSFIQFQAPGYKEPDPRMLEMACRTDGVYQFLNSESMNKSSSDFTKSIGDALDRIRNTFAGSWRVSFPYSSPPGSGKWSSLDADFVFTDSNFSSLALAEALLVPDAWKFRIGTEDSPNVDRRPLLRTACASDTDCGGSDPCGSHHCGEGGICSPVPAPDGRPCSADGKNRCHKGICTPDITCSNAIAP